MRNILVLGAGGFIGSHLVNHLKTTEYNTYVRGVDLKFPEFSATMADDFVIADLRNPLEVNRVIDRHFDQVYQFAADMGGAEYIFSGDNDANVMHNSAMINLNVLDACQKRNISNILYTSSACIYPQENQQDPDNPICLEESAYPANPDSEYGWEKLFSERLYLSYKRNYGLDVKIARLHNIYGPEGAWNGGKEKAPAALCRKVAMADNGTHIELFGDGKQTRSFLYIDDCLWGLEKLLTAPYFSGPVNIGSEEMVTINELAEKIIKISGKELDIVHVPGPIGVAGRNSNNTLARSEMNWDSSTTLYTGLKTTYAWIKSQVDSNKSPNDDVF